MPLPTKQDIVALEDELGFPFRTAFRTYEEDDTDEDTNGAFFRFTVMPSDLRIYG